MGVDGLPRARLTVPDKRLDSRRVGERSSETRPRIGIRVSVVILEPTLESWGVRGGHSADDVDLGFSLDL